MEADIDVVKGDGGGETGPGCSGYSSMVHSKKVIKHALRQQAKRRRKNTTIAAGNSRTLPRIVVKPLPPPPPNDPPSPVNNLPHVNSVVEEPAATMREVLASLPGFSLKSGRRRSTKRLSAAAQLEAGLVDLESPASILASTSLRALLNRHTFQGLPPLYQRKLAQLLPSVDRQDAAISGLNNEFFARACLEWRKRLAEGEFTPENQQRLKMEAERDKNKLDPWKLKHFEPIWGEKREPKLRSGFHCAEPRSVGAVTRSSLRLRPEANVEHVVPENTRCLAAVTEKKMEEVVPEAIVVPDSVPSVQDIPQTLPEYEVTVQILEEENLEEPVIVNTNPEEMIKEQVEENDKEMVEVPDSIQETESQEARQEIEEDMSEERIEEIEEIEEIHEEPEEEMLDSIEISQNISQSEEITHTIELQEQKEKIHEEIPDWEKMQGMNPQLSSNEEIECLSHVSDEISQTSEELSQTSEEPLQFNKEQFSQLTDEQIYQLECENNSTSPQDLMADDSEIIISQGEVHEIQHEIHPEIRHGHSESRHGRSEIRHRRSEIRHEHSEVHSEIQNEMHSEQSEMHSEIQNDMHNEVRHEVHSKIQHEMHPEIQHEMHSKIQHEMHPEIQHKMHSEIRHEIHPEIRHEIHSEIEHEVQPEMHHEIQQEIHHEIQQEMHHENRQEVPHEIQQEMHHEIQQEMHHEIQQEMHHKVQQEIHHEIQQEIHHEIQQDIHHKIHHEMQHDIQQEIHHEIQQEIHHEISQEIHHEIPQEIHHEIPQEIHHEIQPEMQTELQVEMQADIQTEMQTEIQPEIQGSNENCTDPEPQIPEGMEIDIETLQRIHELEVRGEMREAYEEISGCPEEIIYPILEGMEIGSTGEEETEASVISGSVEDVQVQEVEHLTAGNEDEALREANNYVCSEMLECSWAVDPNVGAVSNPNNRTQEEIQVSMPLVTSLDGSVAANITVTTHDECGDTSTTTDSTNPPQFINSDAHTESINCIQLPVVQSTPFQSEALAIGTPVTNCLMKNIPTQSSPIIAFPQLQSIRFVQTSFHSGHGTAQNLNSASAIPAQIQTQQNPQQVSIVRPHEEIVQIGAQGSVVHNNLQNAIQQNPTQDNLHAAVSVQHQNHAQNAIVIQHQSPLTPQSRQIVATLQTQQQQQQQVQQQQYPVVTMTSRPSRSTQGGQRSRGNNKEQGGRSRSSTKEPPGAVNLERSYQICQAVIQSSPNRDQLKAHLKPPPSLLARGDGAFTTTKSGGRTITTIKTQKSQQSNSHNKQSKGQAVMLRHVFTTARQTAPAEVTESNAVTQIGSNGNGGLGQYILVQRTGVGDSAPRASSAPPLPPQIAGMGVGVHLVRGRPASAGEGSHQAVTLKARGALDGRGGGGAEPGAPGVIMGGDPPPPWECNMRGAMVICRQCGAFCHDDCIGPQRICATCLIR